VIMIGRLLSQFRLPDIDSVRGSLKALLAALDNTTKVEGRTSGCPGPRHNHQTGGPRVPYRDMILTLQARSRSS